MNDFNYLLFITLVSGYFFAELIVGLISNSISLQTDAIHMLSDLIALIIGYASMRLTRKEKSVTHSYGYLRSEVIGGLINSTFLLGLSLNLLIEIIEKFTELHEPNTTLENNIDLVLYTAGGGLLINVIGIKLFHSHSHEHNHNSKGVFLHILGDLLASIIVIISSLFIKYTEYSWKFYVDPIASLIVTFGICFSSFKLLISSYNILIHKIPKEIHKEKLIKSLLHINGIVSVDELHIWQLNEKVLIASAHITANRKVLKKCKKVFHDFGIHSSSLQITTKKYQEYICKNNCKELQCC